MFTFFYIFAPMIANDKYKTIAAPANGIYKEKGSKFLAFAYPVSNEDEAKTIIAQVKKEYFDARHHCFAFRFGVDGATYRANDDGEPSGTAGRPIYGQMLSHEITNVLIIVVRYFGGIKLGTSGLINAYKLATIDALENAKIVEKVECGCIKFAFSYAVMNDVMKLIKEEKVEIVNQNLELTCEITISVAKSKITPICDKLKKIDSVIIS